MSVPAITLCIDFVLYMPKNSKDVLLRRKRGLLIFIKYSIVQSLNDINISNKELYLKMFEVIILIGARLNLS